MTAIDFLHIFIGICLGWLLKVPFMLPFYRKEQKSRKDFSASSAEFIKKLEFENNRKEALLKKEECEQYKQYEQSKPDQKEITNLIVKK